MTLSQHGAPGPQHGPPGAPMPAGPAMPPAGPPGYGWYPPQPPRRSKVQTAGTTVAILLATAALVVGIIGLTHTAHLSPSSAPTTTPDTAIPATTTPAGETTEADRALCNAIAPLMTEDDAFSNSYVRLGAAGTPARDSATPKFINDTADWIGRIQPILDQHPNADPFFRRSLQRYIDDQNLMVSDLAPGPLTSYAKVLWSDSVGAYSGPLHICDRLGIKW